MLVEFLQDAVDHNTFNKTALSPTNADAWEQRSGTTILQYSSTVDGSIHDEDVQISGWGFREVMQFMAYEGTLGNPLKKDILKDSVASVVKGFVFGNFWEEIWVNAKIPYLSAYNWCDACDLFVLHQEDIPHTFPGSSPAVPFIDDASGGRYEWFRRVQCVNHSEIIDSIGDPPHPDLRMGADCKICPSQHFADFDPVTGAVTCTMCTNPNQVVEGNSCVNCEWWEKPEGDNCVPCPAGEHFVWETGTCAACPLGTGWDESAQTCANCDIDEIIYLTSTSNFCATLEINQSEVTATDDNCPNELWIEVNNLEYSLDDPQNDVLHAGVETETALDNEACDTANTISQIFSMPTSGNANDAWQFVVGTEQQAYWGEAGSINKCLFGTPPYITQKVG